MTAKKEQSWKVVADHPTLARPDKFGLSPSQAGAYAASLRALGYENVQVLSDEERKG